MKQIDFDLKNIRVQHIFNISPQGTNYKIVRGIDELWIGTELKKCIYRDCEVVFMRVLGSPYEKDTGGYIELKI